MAPRTSVERLERAGKGGACRRGMHGDTRGFSLIEILVGMVITVIAVVGLASLFGNGRALINHYGITREAYGLAQQRLELLGGAGASSELSIGNHPSTPNAFVHQGVTIGTESWRVTWYDDPIDGTGVADSNPNDLKLVSDVVRWGQGVAADSVQLTRLFPSSP